MSRIGRKPITVPAGVEVKIDGTNLSVKGPKGALAIDFHPNMSVAFENGEILVTRPNDEKENRALHGLTRSLINNMVVGVTEGYQKKLEIVGVGYRVEKQGQNLNIALGYSHPVIIEAPAGITFEVPDSNTILVKGIDKQAVGQIAAVIRSKRPPEPYHGKGVKYSDEHIRRKAGKAGK